MWPETHEQVNLELALLRRLMDFHRPMLEKARSAELEPHELSSLAACLHSFYSGIENIFKQIARDIDGSVPSGMFSHSDLLTVMARPTSSRSAVISEELLETLDAYLDFRHVFRHAYTFDLKWRKMADLVLHCEETLDRLQTELEAFLATD